MVEKTPQTGLKNVYSLGVVSFFTDISTEMVLGILPLFILQNLTSSKFLLGVIEGSSEAFSYGLRMVSGSFSDKIGRRKPLVLLGYGVSTVVKPLFAIAASWVDAFIIRLGDRVGKAVRTAPRDALISESVSAEKRGASFGIHKSMDQAGAVVGPVLAFLLLPTVGFTGIFLFSFIPGLIALFVIIFFVKEIKTSPPFRRKVLPGIRKVLDKRFAIFLFALAAFSVGAYNFSFVLVRASDAGITTAVIPLIYAVINIGHTGAGYPSGKLADKIGMIPALIIAYVMFLISTLLSLFLVRDVSSVIVVALLYGAYFGAAETVQRAIIPSLSPKELRGTSYGLYYLVIGSSFLVANLLFGGLWDAYGKNSALTYSSITSIAGILGLAVLTRRRY